MSNMMDVLLESGTVSPMSIMVDVLLESGTASP